MSDTNPAPGAEQQKTKENGAPTGTAATALTPKEGTQNRQGDPGRTRGQGRRTAPGRRRRPRTPRQAQRRSSRPQMRPRSLPSSSRATRSASCAGACPSSAGRSWRSCSWRTPGSSAGASRSARSSSPSRPGASWTSSGTFDDPDDRVVALARRSAALAPPPRLASASRSSSSAWRSGSRRRGRGLPQIGWGIARHGRLRRPASPPLFDARAARSAPGQGRGRASSARSGSATASGSSSSRAVLYFPCWAATRSGIRGRRTTARSRARCSRATTGSRLWWAQDGWFWSQAGLDFWMQAHRDGDARRPLPARPDAHRRRRRRRRCTPSGPCARRSSCSPSSRCTSSTRASRRCSAAARGSSAALVLATMPDWYFLAHQTMTDMPFVARDDGGDGPPAARPAHARGQRGARLRGEGRRARRFRLSAWHLVFGAILVCALPQILYLSRATSSSSGGPGAHGFRPHWDEFRSGSGGGNCGLPGNEACTLTHAGEHPARRSARDPDGFGAVAVRALRRLRAGAPGARLGGAARRRCST